MTPRSSVVLVRFTVFVSPNGPHRPPARVHYKTKRHARWRQRKNDEEAAEHLRRLLAFGPRIRRGAGGGPDPRLREAGTGTRPVPRVRTTGGGGGWRRGAPVSSRGMSAPGF